MPLSIELEQEVDGRWIAEDPELPGVMSYGVTREEAIDRIQALALRVLTDRLDHGEFAASSVRWGHMMLNRPIPGGESGI